LPRTRFQRARLLGVSVTMDILIFMISVLLVLGTLGYLYSINQFYKLIFAIKPEWVRSKASSSFFYEGMPAIGNPNIQFTVIALIFGSKWKGLSHSEINKNAVRARILLPLTVMCFLTIILLGVTNAH